MPHKVQHRFDDVTVPSPYGALVSLADYWLIAGVGVWPQHKEEDDPRQQILPEDIAEAGDGGRPPVGH